jgi:hypothetical protein
MELDNDVYVDAAETQLQQEDNEARHSRLDPDKDLDENVEAKDVGSLRYGERLFLFYGPAMLIALVPQ